MAKLGEVNKEVYTIILESEDFFSLRARLQVQCEGTHVYLKYIVPNPFKKGSVKKKLSFIGYEVTKLKKKTIIYLSEPDLTLLEKGIIKKIKCFVIRKEKEE
jgi:hypothetical protein